MSETSDGAEDHLWDDPSDEGSCEDGVVADPRILALYGKYQRIIDLDAVRHVGELRAVMSQVLADDTIKMRTKLRKFVDMLDSWPILWRDLPAAYNLDPRGSTLRKFFDAPPPGSDLSHKAIAKHAGLSAALDLIVDAYDHDRGRFDRAPLEFYDDLVDLAVELATQVAMGTRDALAKAPPRPVALAVGAAATTLPTADPASSLGRPTSSPAVPGPVSSPGHVVPLGGAVASPSFSIDALGSAQHHCREAAAGVPSARGATAPAVGAAATTLPTADPASSLGRPTSSPAVPGPVSSPGHVVPLGGAVASPSFSIDALGSAQHHCREAAAGVPSARGATAAAEPDGHPPVRLLSNAQVKKLPTAERKKYKAQLKALEARTQSKADDKTDAGREPASTTRGEVPHFARDSEAASPATASAVTGTSGSDRAGARSGKQVTFAGGPGDRRADLGRD